MNVGHTIWLDRSKVQLFNSDIRQATIRAKWTANQNKIRANLNPSPANLRQIVDWYVDLFRVKKSETLVDCKVAQIYIRRLVDLELSGPNQSY